MPSNYSRNTGKFIFLADILKNSVCDKVTGIEMLHIKHLDCAWYGLST